VRCRHHLVCRGSKWRHLSSRWALLKLKVASPKLPKLKVASPKLLKVASPKLPKLKVASPKLLKVASPDARIEYMPSTLPRLSVRVELERITRWRAIAEQERLSLSAWLSKLADEACERANNPFLRAEREKEEEPPSPAPARESGPGRILTKAELDRSRVPMLLREYLEGGGAPSTTP